MVLLLLLLRLVVMARQRIVCTRTGYGQPGWDSGRQQRTGCRRDHVAVVAVVVTIAADVVVVAGAARNGAGTVVLLL